MTVLTLLRVNDHSAHSHKVHLVCPLQSSPNHRTVLFSRNETVEIELHKGPFFLVLHSYEANRLAKREVKEIDLHQNSAVCAFDSATVHLSLSSPAQYETDNTFRSHVQGVTNRLSLYVQQDLQRLQSMQPMELALQHTHSVYYEFPMQQTVYVPYVGLAGRFGDRVACTEEVLHDWQSFFIREVPVVMRECAIQPSEFLNTCRKSNMTAGILYHIYNSIAVAFSRLVASRVKYEKDIEATTMTDYVGFNVVNGELLVGDCEDGSQLLYDVMRIFRTIFPITQNDLQRGQTSLCYFMAHFLNKSELWMLQGSVGENRETHVWCGIMPHSGPVHFVESTGLPQAAFYRHIVRAWQLDHAGHFADVLLVNPDTGKYGLPCNNVANIKADGQAVFRRWANRNQTIITDDLKFVNLLDSPLMHPMDLLMRKF